MHRSVLATVTPYPFPFPLLATISREWIINLFTRRLAQGVIVTLLPHGVATHAAVKEPLYAALRPGTTCMANGPTVTASTSTTQTTQCHRTRSYLGPHTPQGVLRGLAVQWVVVTRDTSVILGGFMLFTGAHLVLSRFETFMNDVPTLGDSDSDSEIT